MMTSQAHRPHSLSRIDWPEFERHAQRAGVSLPVEQTPAWDRFDDAMDGRQPWGRLLWRDAQGEPRALLSLTRMDVRGVPYLWGRHAPVWLGEQPSAEEEARLRRALVGALRRRDRTIAFVRLHAEAPAPDLHELLQTMTYDRTVIIDLNHDSDEEVLASFKSRGRRDVRKALRIMDAENAVIAEETEHAEDVFDELYEVLLETGQRDGFRALPKATYLTMLSSLGPEHARIFTVRDSAGAVLVWSLVTVWGDHATRYYAGSSAAGRRMRAADALVYQEACWLRAQGVRSYDLMGVDSQRVPELAGVREFKNKFVTDGPVGVPGAWDVPVWPGVYRALVRALQAKRALVAWKARCVQRLRRVQ